MSAATDPKNTAARQDFYLLRLLATGLAFALFGVFGLLFRLLAYPLLLLLTGEPLRRRRIARLLIGGFFRAFIELMVLLRAMTYRVDGAARLRQPGTLIVSNPPSLFDVVMLVAFVPDACCVVKKALWSNPFMNGPLRAADYIDNGDPLAMLERARAEVLTGAPLIIFPEGTRTEKGGRPVFGRSAANLSVRSGRPVVPVFIQVEPTTLTRNERWYEVPYRRVRFTLTVGEPCEPVAAGETDLPVTVQVRRQQDRIMAFMNRMLDGDHPAPPEDPRAQT